MYGHFRPWYTSLGTLIAITVGLLVSFTFKHNDPRDVNPALLAPCIRNLIKPREFPNQPAGNEIIYAYEREVGHIYLFVLLIFVTTNKLALMIYKLKNLLKLYTHITVS